MLEVGQFLWWIDHNTKAEGKVVVTRVEKGYFSVKYKGKEIARPYSVLGTKLFYTPQLTQTVQPTSEPSQAISEIPHEQSQPATKECSNCFLRYSGECTSIRNELCEDYRARQASSKEEMRYWPDWHYQLSANQRHSQDNQIENMLLYLYQ